MQPASSSVQHSAYQQLFAELTETLHALDATGLRRQVMPVEAINGPMMHVDGRQIINWCSNDYLGLSMHPALAEASSRAARKWGIGARASRLLAGTTRLHHRFEEALAAWFGAEAALVYPSGYLTNLGTLTALVDRSDFVVMDRFVHASLVDAARATNATLRVFRHNDLDHLAAVLTRAPRTGRRVVITEGVFSMEGDTPPLASLVELAAMHDALVYLDDAHGAFVMGSTGRGTPEAAGIAHDRLIYMGTLGKALGCQGGFVVGPRVLIEWLQNRARTFIYTTALATPLVAAAHEALQVLEREPQRRLQLFERVRDAHERLKTLDLPISANASYIMPIILGAIPRTTVVASALWEQGLWAPAIRPPTVPHGSARLRISLTALHTTAHLETLGRALQQAVGTRVHATS